MEIVAYKGRPFSVFVDEFLSYFALLYCHVVDMYIYQNSQKIQPTGSMSSVLTVLLRRDPPLSFRRILL